MDAIAAEPLAEKGTMPKGNKNGSDSEKGARILLVDDDQNFRRVAQVNIQLGGYVVETAENAASALEKLKVEPFALVVTDVRMPGGSGLDLVKSVREFSRVPIIVMTAFGSIEIAVDAMRHGAQDFITKPFDREELLESIERCLSLAKDDWAADEDIVSTVESESDGVPATDSKKANRSAKPAARRKAGTAKDLIGKSPSIEKIKDLIAKLADRDVTVLITGESGVGKEVVARSIHQASARANKGNFIAMNCSAIPRELLESELFGHVKGSFTGAVADRAGKFEQAHGGTLFLDEIGDMPSELQAKILRAIQEREIERVGGDGKPFAIDVRIIAATHRDLEKMMKEEKFRQDLYYRLAVVKMAIPALRERVQDIAPLVQHFIKKYGGEDCLELTEAALKRLEEHRWPGNVRELENVVQYAIALRAAEDRIDEDDLPEVLAEMGSNDPLVSLPVGGIVLADVEAKLIEAALKQAKGNQTKAAELLSITRQTLIYRIQKYEIAKAESNEIDGDT